MRPHGSWVRCSGVRASRVRDEAGETLVELLAALTILGIAAVAILSGLQLSTKTSDLQRRQATGGAYVRSFAEAVQAHVDTAGLAGCGSAAATYGGVAVPDLPSGYTTTVTRVRSWQGAGWGPCAADGPQQLELEVTSAGDGAHRATERLTLVLRRPCTGPAALATDSPCA